MGNCAFFNLNRNENQASNGTVCITTANTTAGIRNPSTTITINSLPMVMERVDSSIDTVWNLTKRQEDECEEIFSVFEEDDGE